MKTDLVTVSPDDTMKTVEDIFKKAKFHHLPVEWDGHLVGIVSKSDYLFFKRGFSEDGSDTRMDNLRLKTRKVKEFMTTGLAHLEPTDKINVALEVFKENLFHAIPVVEDGKIVGMVTTFDVINALSERGQKQYNIK